MAFVNIYFSLGSNLGDRKKNISEALSRMDEAFGSHYSALSRLIETKPMGFSGGKFLNAAVLYRIPAPVGEDYHSRVIDIDILFYGSERIDLPVLTIPHKGIASRPFVMIPLQEIAKPSLKKAFPEYFNN